MSEILGCSASVGNVKISSLDFVDDGVIFVDLKVLNEESEPLALHVSWVKSKIQDFNDILDAAMFSVPICGEDVDC